MCDNTDCESEYKELYLIEIKKEFEGGTANWCRHCIAREDNFINKINGEKLN